MRRRSRDVPDRSGEEASNAEARLTYGVINEINWFMSEQKISQAELAKSMGVSPGRVSQILSGDGNLTLKTLATVAAALNARFHVVLRPVGEYSGQGGAFDHSPGVA